MDAEQFKKQFADNLRKNILKNFRTQKEFADFFDESKANVSRWCGGEVLPDLYKIYRICESMGITIDYLIKGEPDNLTSDSIDYDIFNEVVKMVNDFAKKIKLKKVKGKRYFFMQLI